VDLVSNKLCNSLYSCMQYFDNPLIIFIAVAIVVVLSIALIHQRA
jgi:hypothetical protein